MTSIPVPTCGGYCRAGVHFPLTVKGGKGGSCLGARRLWLIDLLHRSLGYRNGLVPIEGEVRFHLLGPLWRPGGLRAIRCPDLFFGF